MLGRDDPYFVGELVGYGFEYGEAGGVDAVVVGEENAGDLAEGCRHDVRYR
jgi:hypothetical protein